MQVSLFDGQPSPKLSLTSMSVLEALIARRQKESSREDRRIIRHRLKQGQIGSVILGLLTWDSWKDCKGLPYARLHIGLAVWRLCQSKMEWISGNQSAICQNIYKMLEQNSHVLAYDNYRYSSPGLDGVWSQKRLGWTWLLGGGSGPLSLPGSVALLVGERLYHGKTYWDEWKPEGPVGRSIAVHSKEAILLLLPLALETALRWLAEPELFQRCSTDKRDEVQSILSHQLHEVSRHVSARLLARSPLIADKGRPLAAVSWWQSFRGLRLQVTPRTFELSIP